MASALHKEEATLAEIDARVKTEVLPFIEDIKSFHRTDKIEDRIPERNNELVFYSDMLEVCVGQFFRTASRFCNDRDFPYNRFPNLSTLLDEQKEFECKRAGEVVYLCTSHRTGNRRHRH